MQLPEPHSAANWHTEPLLFVGRQTPPALQYFPEPQEVDVHEVAHFVPSAAQPSAMQAVVTAAVHAPMPLQTVWLVTIPLLHVIAVHSTVFPGKLHTVPSVPSHRPVHAPVPAHEVRMPRGTPATTAQ